MTLRARRASTRLIAVLLGCAVATPSVAAVDCYEQMSRIPAASPAALGSSGYRAAMLRGGARAAPSKSAAHRPARKVARKAKAPRRAAVLHKAGGVGKKAVARKAHARGGAVKRPAHRAVAAGPALRPQPTSPAVAAREIAKLREFTLIKTTICTSIAPPTLIIEPPTEPVTVPPPLDPPGPDTFGPEITIFPPGEETLVVVLDPPRPPGPPPFDPLPRPVPEPGTWLLLILGFGALGARLRARRAAVG